MGDERERRRSGEGIGLGLAAGAWPLGANGSACWEDQVASWASLLSLLFPFSRKVLERIKRKIGLGKEFAHAGNFPGLTKMFLFRENRKGHG